MRAEQRAAIFHDSQPQCPSPSFYGWDGTAWRLHSEAVIASSEPQTAMRYNESDLDKSIRNWFLNDFSKRMLRQISLEKGRLRSVSNFSVSLNYPISAIAGKNGAGKSTLIAIACCAYHNAKSGYKPAKRNQPYYTFKDFFIQRPEENSANEDIQIRYNFALDTWADKKKFPDGKGIGYQLRKKAPRESGMTITSECTSQPSS